MGEIDAEKLIELLAVTQQHYYDLKPIATKIPDGLLPAGSVTMLRQLEGQAKEVLGDLPPLVPPVGSLMTEYHLSGMQLENHAGLMWVAAMHACLMTKLPPEEEQARKQFGLLPPE